MENKQVPRTVFYAWQSDSPEAYNRFFIRDALKKALRVIAKANVAAPPLEYDDATRNTAGSIMIVDSILRKIDACDVFVGDISIISPLDQPPRRVPNPNVMFEAGWAAARLGWNRVVLVFNRATGTIENDVPFDLRGRRILQYELHDRVATRKAVEDALVADLVSAVKAALDSPRPIRKKRNRVTSRGISTNEEQQRDRETIYRLLGRLDTQWVDAYLANLQDEKILNDADVHFLEFTGVVEEARFRLFDRRTENTIRAFATAWHRLHEATIYGDAVVGARFARFRPESYGSGGEVARMRRDLRDAVQATDVAYRAMIARLHNAYADFDLRESDTRAREYFAGLQPSWPPDVSH